jgi:citrate lyase subunit beta / citryl-CoA lyase
MNARMRSKLFVPGSRPELFAKALSSAADAVSFDLEDAVEKSRKSAARMELVRMLAQGLPTGGKLIIVRVNAVHTEHFEADLEAVVHPGVDVINLPMVDGAEAIRHAAAKIDQLELASGISRPMGILANIESPRGLRLGAEIACAHPRIVGLQVGFGDLFSSLGIAPGEPSASRAVRLAVRLAASEAGIPAYDGAYVNIGDTDGFIRDASDARQLGFAGKSCIHPSQIALANKVFRPSDAEIGHALRVVRASQDALARGVGAFVVDGRMIDAPFIRQAEETVELAQRLGILSR